MRGRAMAAGRKTGGGARRGRQNKTTVELKGMILGALDQVGGQDYLAVQAQSNPSAFLTLVGKVLPATLQHTGPTGGAVEIAMLSPEERADRAQQMIEQAFAEVVKEGEKSATMSN